MNISFDYYNYLKQEEIKHEVKIDLSGIPLQNDASTVIADPDTGEVSEVNLNEDVDENVNFVFLQDTTISADEKYLRGEDVIARQNDIVISESGNPSLVINGINIPIIARHKLMKDTVNQSIKNVSSIQYIGTSVKYLGPSERVSQRQYKVTLTAPHNFVNTFINESDYNTFEINKKFFNLTQFYYVVFSEPTAGVSAWDVTQMYAVSHIHPTDNKTFYIRTLSALPDVTLPNVIQLSSVSISKGVPNKRVPLVSREIYAAFNLWSNNKYNTSPDLGTPNRKARGYISKKQYYDRLRNLEQILNPKGIDIIATPYMASEDDAGNDINASFMTRSSKFDDAIDASVKFINSKNIAPLSSADVTPFVLSVKDLFKQVSDSADELEQQLISGILDLVNLMSDIPSIGGVDTSQFNFITAINPPAIAGSAYNPNTGGIQYITNPQSGEVYATKVDSTVTAASVTSPVAYTVFLLDSGGNLQPIKEYTIAATGAQIVPAVEELRSFLNQLQAASTITSLGSFGASSVLITAAIEAFKSKFVEIDDVLNRIYWFQKYTNESILDDKSFIYSNEAKFYGSTLKGQTSQNPKYTFNEIAARLLIAVDFGKKRKKVKKKNLFGIPYTDYKTVDLGVRWVEIKFIDTTVFGKYRKNDTPPGIPYKVNIPLTSVTTTPSDLTNAIAILSTPLSAEIMDTEPTEVSIKIIGSSDSRFNGSYSATVISDAEIHYTIPTEISQATQTGAILDTIILPFPTTLPSDELNDIRVSYAIPYLPDDADLRDAVFAGFGPFDQSQYANRKRGGDSTYDLSGNLVETEYPSGWQIFHESSKQISDMRTGIDIYNKAQFLLKILQTEFSSSRVHLIETMRSAKDQDILQLGGPASNFLSWHNFGLAMKIKITEDDGITAIKDGTDDALKLLDIAEAFVENCKAGKFGEPMNVVWCGQLVTNPDLFVWEFLPIGVNHKDAPKFRDSAYAQQDAIVSNSFVNVTKMGYIIDDSEQPPTNTPYIRSGSKAIQNAITINGEKWVHPKDIKNYTIPNQLVLKDLQEFLSLVNRKMAANGTSLTGSKRIQEWKAKNPISFNQLVMFYGLCGNYSAVRGLLSGDYIQQFQSVVSTLAELDPINFVKTYLGDSLYSDAKIYVDNLPDSSYIALNNGTLTIPVLEIRSTQPEGSGNTFGQRQIDFDHVEFGQYQDGVFVAETDSAITLITTDVPVIDGYEDGVAVDSDAYIIHKLIADQIVEEFNTILNDFNNLNIRFMHDSFVQGSNADLLDMLENEFGVIQAQDLLTFDQLRQLYARILINDKKSEFDGTVRGAGANIESQNTDPELSNRNENQSVFEKLVSNAQLSGLRLARLTKEKPIIEPLKNEVNVEKVINLIQRNKKVDVRDIL